VEIKVPTTDRKAKLKTQGVAVVVVLTAAAAITTTTATTTVTTRSLDC
jgi:hypothetical protein